MVQPAVTGSGARRRPMRHATTRPSCSRRWRACSARHRSLDSSADGYSQLTEVAPGLSYLFGVGGVQLLAVPRAFQLAAFGIGDDLRVGGRLGLLMGDESGIGADRSVDRLQRSFIAARLLSAPFPLRSVSAS